jgi:alcohol dehydrogenase, propanol-preferring
MRIRVPVPHIGAEGILLRVRACGLCTMDAALAEGLQPGAQYPVIPGHAVVGEVVEYGRDVRGFSVGDRVGAPRLAWACGHCRTCLRGLEHLCRARELNGLTVDGGLAEYVRVDHRFCFHLPRGAPDAALAPLLCEGAIGHRAMRMVDGAQRVGLYGAGPVAALAAQVGRRRGHQIRMPDGGGASGSLDAAVVLGPAKDVVRAALQAVVEGGRVVWVSELPNETAGIAVPLLAGEREILSVAGAGRRDVAEVLALSETAPLDPVVETFRMGAAEEALARLRSGGATATVVVVADAR